ncbi:CIA30 family protein [Robertkochia sediminum]|uniref:CIA30 family protein n=1 Tax=Robertkochia sediminum TaxID=2785326 RepID=UPI00193435C2|nr:CIA30 family protein [Robertkochia sediminum]MBL7471336.1 CIA30 family protein [Robertkochia sediminum]
MNAQSSFTLYDFKAHGDTSDWLIINDGVMGGRSRSSLEINKEGYGEFCGHVSLANNGGFASVRLRFAPIAVSAYSVLYLKVKGTPGRYQVRCRSEINEPQSYVAWFEADGTWQDVILSLDKMSPVYRGRQLDLPDYPGQQMAEFGILVGNKKEQDFCLEIAAIRLEE